MNANTSAAHVSYARICRLEAQYELLKVLRMPGYVIPSIAFPVMFYVLFGVLFGRRAAGSVSMATYLIATYGAFGVIGASLFGFGVGVAVERGQGWLVLKRASPMPPLAFLAAKLFVCMLFAAAIVSLLIATGTAFAGVKLPLPAALVMGATLILGTVPFCALGLAAGYLTGANSAPALINLTYLPMAFLSGLWIPVEALPAFVRALAPYLPAYHLAQLALRAAGAGAGAPAWAHLSALTGFTILGLALAVWGYRRDEDRTWG
jgi:ABC-2 type transport system permease protein